jgi:hypothetical protein
MISYLYSVPSAKRRNEDFPDAGAEPLAHRVPAAVPVVEVADDGHALRIGRPHGEVHAVDAFVRRRVRAEPVVQLGVPAFPDQPVVDGPEHGPVRIRIIEDPRVDAIGRAQAIRRAARNRAFEEAGVMAAQKRGEQRAVTRDHVDGVSAGNERTHDEPATRLVYAEHGERIFMPPVDDRVDDCRRQRCRHRSTGAVDPQASPGSARQISCA